MYVVAALYKFVSLPDYTDIQPKLLKVCLDNEIKGTLLLAHEGINGTVSGTRAGIDILLSYLRSDPRLLDLEVKESESEDMPFYRTKVRLKKEIVTLGQPNIDPNELVGTYVEPADWNELIAREDVTLIDVRNDYEIEIGSFKGAVDPDTRSFREFPEYVKDNLNPEKQKKVAMFCTGGIRCEKASAYMLQQGFAEVYHLKGGILKYLEEVPAAESYWEGDCFVFDNRVAVNHALEVSDYDQCHACRRPITEEDKQHEDYQRGVSCHKCINEQTDEQRARFSERQKQIDLAKSRGEQHIAQQFERDKLIKFRHFFGDEDGLSEIEDQS